MASNVRLMHTSQSDSVTLLVNAAGIVMYRRKINEALELCSALSAL